MARRWLRGAPAPDAVWEYADLRLPAAELDAITLEIAGQELAFGDVEVAARRSGPRLDVSLHHPVFARVDEPTQTQVAFLALDAALGEADTELWVGEVGTSTVPLIDAFGLVALRAAVRDLKADCVDANGNPVWALLRGDGATGPVLAAAMVPLSPLIAPDLDVHVAVVVPYVDRTDEGFPGPGSLDALRALEDHIAQRLGDSGRIVAHQSHRGVRTLHAYVAGMTPAVDQVRAAVSGWDQGEVAVESTPDPSWSAVAHLKT